ncbi:MAG: Trk system potassium transporter TrkA [Lewinella sp.]|jgi:trk system potassium uptake protein TrkA|uniref:Trk system potassium transporter TrkA n=1 Tax=Lewinella sp. TaxID=2004506 RepID=UPI003D6B302C
MKIIIAGAGDVGFHLAELLAYENQDITLIDLDQEVLDYAASHLDVLTIKGDCGSIDILEQAEAGSANIVLAVTTSEKTNLVVCILAKKMGARQTIARVNNQEYLAESQRQTFAELGVDNIISPVYLAAEEIRRLVKQAYFTDIFEFEEGRISLVGVTLDESSPLINICLKDLPDHAKEIDLRPIAVLRGHRTIIPRGETILRQNDHVYFITAKSRIDDLRKFIDCRKVNVRKIMIMGGSELSRATAQLLEKDYNVTLIANNKECCKTFSETLTETLIINGDFSNVNLLVEEGLDNMDAFIALTGNSETNIIASLTAKNHGVYKTIAQVENKEYVHISQNIGVDTLINKKLIAANNIFRFVRKGKVEAVTSLHGVDAEVIEFIVHKPNQLTKKPLRDLHFPEAALIGGVIRGEESLFPDGDFQLEVNDKVIVFTLPEAISKVEKLFR